jgi:hypothetical protein
MHLIFLRRVALLSFQPESPIMRKHDELVSVFCNEEGRQGILGPEMPRVPLYLERVQLVFTKLLLENQHVLGDISRDLLRQLYGWPLGIHENPDCQELLPQLPGKETNQQSQRSFILI